MPNARNLFRVGQRCCFVFGPLMGWHRINGEECVIIAPKQRVDVWCEDFGGGNRRLARDVERYLVSWREGEVWTAEETLRPLDIYQPALDSYQSALSTWDKFVRKTGIDPREAPRRQHRKGGYR